MSSSDPSLQFSITCIGVDEEKGPPTLQYLFYELPFPVLPFQLDRFFIVNGWTNGEGQYRQSIKIIDTTKTKTLVALVESKVEPFALKDPYEPFMTINLMQNITFKNEGLHWVQIFLNENLVLQYPLMVRLVAGVVKIQPPDSEARPKRFSASFS